MSRPCGVVAGGLAVVLASVAARGADPIVTTDLLRLRSVSAIEVARDGSKAVVAVRSVAEARGSGNADGADRSRYANRSHLFLAPLEAPSVRPRQLTFGARYDHSPALSPDGRRVAFVRASDQDDETAQVWLLPLDGGEARRLTALPHGAGAPRWAPDGRTLLVSAPVLRDDLDGAPPWPTERPVPREDAGADATPRPAGRRAEVRAWLDENARDDDPTVITRLGFQGETSLRERERFRHLFLVDPDDPAAVPRRLTQGFRDGDAAVFAPDGRAVFYVAKVRDDVHPDRQIRTGLRRVTLPGGEDRLVLAPEGWSLRAPRPSPDGSVLAFLAQQTDEPAFRQRRVGIASVTTEGLSEPVWLTDDEGLDASVRGLEWTPARSALVFTAGRRGGVALFTMSLGLLEPAVLVDEEHGMPVGVHAFGTGGGALVYALTSASNPCVLRVRDAGGERRLWDLNEWVAGRDLVRPEGGWITRPDGVRVQFWLMEPARRLPGETYPLALEIHGGPAGMWGPGEATMWHEFQLLCSWGYGVVYANPRGSDGYGYAFRKGNERNWGAGPAGDVLAAVDQVLATPWVDPDRLVVTGGSYGGYLTAWIVAHDHRFKAAVAQRGVYDLTTFAGEGNAWRLVEWAMGGFPWDPRARPVLERESPFTAVSRIRTPLLILHGSRDLRTGVSQSEMMYRALKQLDRPVEYVRYPDAGHDLSRTGDPGQRMDRLNRIIDFFDRAVGNERPAPRLSGE